MVVVFDAELVSLGISSTSSTSESSHPISVVEELVSASLLFGTS